MYVLSLSAVEKNCYGLHCCFRLYTQDQARRVHSHHLTSQKSRWSRARDITNDRDLTIGDARWLTLPFLFDRWNFLHVSRFPTTARYFIDAGFLSGELLLLSRLLCSCLCPLLSRVPKKNFSCLMCSHFVSCRSQSICLFSRRPSQPIGVYTSALAATASHLTSESYQYRIAS